jgi:hypothetical protein
MIVDVHLMQTNQRSTGDKKLSFQSREQRVEGPVSPIWLVAAVGSEQKG